MLSLDWQKKSKQKSAEKQVQIHVGHLSLFIRPRHEAALAGICWSASMLDPTVDRTIAAWFDHYHAIRAPRLFLHELKLRGATELKQTASLLNDLQGKVGEEAVATARCSSGEDGRRKLGISGCRALLLAAGWQLSDG